MENAVSEPSSGVEIEITAPSAVNSEDEMGEEFIPRALIESSNSIQNEIDSSSDQTFSEEPKLHEDGENSQQGDSEEDEELAKVFDKDLTVDEDGESNEAEPTHTATGENKPANLEMIGDRVLIERDGKFELVDVSEIKAEYFEMLGINSPEKQDPNNKESALENGDHESSKKTTAVKEEKPAIHERPKTTVAKTRRKNTKNSPERRTASARLSRSRNDEYGHIKSMYGMSDEQLEIKRRREEAIAKRKKEEKERENEEMRRKREDAERAFQAWLAAKIEEARERRLEEARNKPDPSLEQRKREDAESAYQDWLIQKKLQNKLAKEYEAQRRSEEASQFVIRDRHLCDEAFKSWLRKKREEARARDKLKSKRKKPKSKLKKKEPLPLNSKNITYLEYYGYRNHVVL